jgi:hypothetical protein
MTVFNQHTVHELDDLVKALSYQVGQITQASSQCAAWKQRDPQGYAAWSSDLSKATAEWARVSHAAMKIIDRTPHVAWDMAPVESDYQAVAKAFQPFEGLTGTFMRDSHCPLSFPDNPQPTAPDADLVAFQATDAAAKWIDKEAKGVAKRSKTVVPFVIGGVGLAVVAVLLARRAVGRAVREAVEG